MRHVPGVAHAAHGNRFVPLRNEALKVTLGVLVGKAFDQRRENQARDHTVESYPFRRIDHRRGLGHLHQGRLARRVGHLRLADVAQPGDRGNVDDRAAALALHDGQHMFAGEKCAFDVDIHLLVPDGLVHGNRVARLGTPHVVDQDVDTPKPVHAGINQRFDLGRVRHVAGPYLTGAAFRLDQFTGLLRGLQIQIAAENTGALSGQQDGNRLAIAPTFTHGSAPRDEGHFSIESKHVDSFFKNRLRYAL